MNPQQIAALQALVAQLESTPLGKALESRWPGLTALLNFLSSNAALLPQLIALLDALFSPPKLMETKTETTAP